MLSLVSHLGDCLYALSVGFCVAFSAAFLLFSSFSGVIFSMVFLFVGVPLVFCFRLRGLFSLWLFWFAGFLFGLEVMA